MSSLLQFNGKVESGKVGLQFTLVRKIPWIVGDLHLTKPEDVDTHICTVCGGSHARIHEAFRKPAGMFGCWVVFRYNGEEHVPDLSIPISVEKLPRDARRLNDTESSQYWHTEA